MQQCVFCLGKKLLKQNLDESKRKTHFYLFISIIKDRLFTSRWQGRVSPSKKTSPLFIADFLTLNKKLIIMFLIHYQCLLRYAYINVKAALLIEIIAIVSFRIGIKLCKKPLLLCCLFVLI